MKSLSSSLCVIGGSLVIAAAGISGLIDQNTMIILVIVLLPAGLFGGVRDLAATFLGKSAGGKGQRSAPVELATLAPEAGALEAGSVVVDGGRSDRSTGPTSRQGEACTSARGAIGSSPCVHHLATYNWWSRTTCEPCS